MNNAINFENQAITPSKVVCIGRNYVDHIKELNNEMPTEPVIFIKPNSAICEHLAVHEQDEIHYEGEISLLIRQGQVAGVGFGLDLTKRELQSTLKAKGLPWERAKAFDKSATFSDFVALNQPVSSLRMELFINEQLIQAANYELMLHKPEMLLKEIASFLTLADGDIVMTGTPKGVGKVNAGDQFVGKIFSDNTLLVEHYWIAES